MICLEKKKFIESLPKTETHLHIEGALPWEMLLEKDSKRFGFQPEFRKKQFRYESFEQFESTLIEHALLIFDSPESYHEASKLIFEKHLDQNVRYVEISFHAGMIEILKIPGEEIVEAIHSAIPHGLKVKIFIGISRNAYNYYLSPQLEKALVDWDYLAGIDLHGLESLPLEDWTVPFWNRAAENGKILKAHAGEFGPDENISHAIDYMGVRRIQHGVRAIENEEVLKHVIKLGVVLDMCPISNYKLKVVNDWASHPLKRFLDMGISCTISTDDPFSFGNSLTEEYETCIDKLGCSLADLATLAKNGFEVADIELDEKKSHQKEINDLLVEFLSSNGK